MLGRFTAGRPLTKRPRLGTFAGHQLRHHAPLCSYVGNCVVGSLNALHFDPRPVRRLHRKAGANVDGAPSVAVGISGGVDSSVTALLLAAAGFRVHGVFMRNWDASDEVGNEVCTATEDRASARAVSSHLSLPTLREVDFVPEYWSDVFSPFLDAYARGATPNPDVSCNRHVKFGAFRQLCLSAGGNSSDPLPMLSSSSTSRPPGKQLQSVGADFMALGHYSTVWPPPLPPPPAAFFAAATASLRRRGEAHQRSDVLLHGWSPEAALRSLALHAPDLFAAHLLQLLREAERSERLQHLFAAAPPAAAAMRSPPDTTQPLPTGPLDTKALHAELLQRIFGESAGASAAAAMSDSALTAEHKDGHPTGPELLSSCDQSKDQSDFLCSVPGPALKRVLLPLGQLHKSDVRALASAARLPSASRKDSYGICFIGKRPLKEFLAQYLPLTPAAFADVETGQRIGETDAAEAWTPGQRARLSGSPKPLFVVSKQLARLDADITRKASAAGGGSAVVDLAWSGKHNRAVAVAGPATDKDGARRNKLDVSAGNSKSSAVLRPRGSSDDTIWLASGHAHPALLCDAAALRLTEATLVQAPVDATASGAPLQAPSLPEALQPLLAAAIARKGRLDSLVTTRTRALRFNPLVRPQHATEQQSASRLLRVPEWLRSYAPAEAEAEAAFAVPSASGAFAAAAVADAVPLLPVRYRIRHRQTDFHSAAVAIMWASEWRAAAAAALMRQAARLQRAMLGKSAATAHGSSSVGDAHASARATAAAAAARDMLRRGLPQKLRGAFDAAAGGAASMAHAQVSGDAASVAGRRAFASTATGSDLQGHCDGDGDGDELLLVAMFQHPQRAVAEGQQLVLYEEAVTLPPPATLPGLLADEGTPPAAPEQAAGGDATGVGSEEDAAPAAAAAASHCTTHAWRDGGRAVIGGGPIWCAGLSLLHAATDVRALAAPRPGPGQLAFGSAVAAGKLGDGVAAVCLSVGAEFALAAAAPSLAAHRPTASSAALVPGAAAAKLAHKRRDSDGFQPKWAARAAAKEERRLLEAHALPSVLVHVPRAADWVE